MPQGHGTGAKLHGCAHCREAAGNECVCLGVWEMVSGVCIGVVCLRRSLIVCGLLVRFKCRAQFKIKISNGKTKAGAWGYLSI